MGSRVEIGIELRITNSNTMINHHLSQEFKLIGNGEFIYSTLSRPMIEFKPKSFHRT
jgi:hypothetical protein